MADEEAYKKGVEQKRSFTFRINESAGRDVREALAAAVRQLPEQELKNFRGGHITVVL